VEPLFWSRTVDLSAALAADLFTFFDSVGLDPALTAEAVDDVQLTLREVVPACLGFRLELVSHGLAVCLTSFEPPVDPVDIRTSLHVPLLVLGLLRLPLTTAMTSAQFDPDSSLTLYGARSGAFVDLAADLTYALTTARRASPGLDSGNLRRPTSEAFTLDQHLTPSSTTSGFAGAADLSTMDRAVGYLIGQGHDSDLALEELRRRAAVAGLAVLVYAAQLLGR